MKRLKYQVQQLFPIDSLCGLTLCEREVHHATDVSSTADKHMLTTGEGLWPCCSAFEQLLSQ